MWHGWQRDEWVWAGPDLTVPLQLNGDTDCKRDSPQDDQFTISDAEPTTVPSFAVIALVPADMPVANPEFEMVATDVSEDCHAALLVTILLDPSE
jgi:hypothetical protein